MKHHHCHERESKHHEQHQNGQRKRISWKLITSAVIALGLVVTVIAVNVNEQKDSSATSLATERGELSVAEQLFDFGTVSMAAGKISREFTVTNASAFPATVKQLSTSCMCTSAELAYQGKTEGPFGMPGHGIIPKINTSIKPASEAIVKVTFDPAAHGPSGVGAIARDVYLDQEGGKRLTLKIKAFVTP